MSARAAPVLELLSLALDSLDVCSAPVLVVPGADVSMSPVDVAAAVDPVDAFVAFETPSPPHAQAIAATHSVRPHTAPS